MVPSAGSVTVVVAAPVNPHEAVNPALGLSEEGGTATDLQKRPADATFPGPKVQAFSNSDGLCNNLHEATRKRATLRARKAIGHRGVKCLCQ